MNGSQTATISAPPAAVFDAITDIEHLPEWNARMQRVVEKPDALVSGAEWVVEFRALGSTWHSRSEVREIDAGAGRFVHSSATDDGNPSRAVWTWQVNDDPGGSRLTVSWELHPKTFWRRVLLARVRNYQLTRTEVRTSLAALAQRLAAVPGTVA